MDLKVENHSEITQEWQKLANVNKDESPLEQEVGERGVGLPEGNLMVISTAEITPLPGDHVMSDCFPMMKWKLSGEQIIVQLQALQRGMPALGAMAWHPSVQSSIKCWKVDQLHVLLGSCTLKDRPYPSLRVNKVIPQRYAASQRNYINCTN